MQRIDTYKLFHGSLIPNWILKWQKPSANAKLVYARLSQYGNSSGEVFPGLDRIAEDSGMHRRTVDRAIKELKDLELIEVNRRGLGKTNEYYFLEHSLMNLPKSGNQLTTELSSTKTTDVSHPYIKKKTEEKDSPKNKTAIIS